MLEGSVHAQEIIQSWISGEWFTSRLKVPEKITVTVFKVAGTTNPGALSPVLDAAGSSRYYFTCFSYVKNLRESIVPDDLGKIATIYY